MSFTENGNPEMLSSLGATVIAERFATKSSALRMHWRHTLSWFSLAVYRYRQAKLMLSRWTDDDPND